MPSFDDTLLFNKRLEMEFTKPFFSFPTSRLDSNPSPLNAEASVLPLCHSLLRR